MNNEKANATWFAGPPEHRWIAVTREGKWFAGRLGTPIDDAAKFATQWAAEAHARFCNRIDRIQYECEQQLAGISPVTKSDWTFIYDGAVGSSHIANEFRSGGHVYARFVDGQLVDLDLPYLVCIWLRSTPLIRGIKKGSKAFWYGWGR